MSRRSGCFAPTAPRAPRTPPGASGVAGSPELTSTIAPPSSSTLSALSVSTTISPVDVFKYSTRVCTVRVEASMNDIGARESYHHTAADYQAQEEALEDKETGSGVWLYWARAS